MTRFRNNPHSPYIPHPLPNTKHTTATTAIATQYATRAGRRPSTIDRYAFVVICARSSYWTTKVTLISMFIKNKIKAALAVFDKQVESNTEVHRPGRKSPRKKKPPRLYHMNYKDL